MNIFDLFNKGQQAQQQPAPQQQQQQKQPFFKY